MSRDITQVFTEKIMSVTKLGSGTFGAVFRTPKGDEAVKFFLEDNCMTNIREINIMQCVSGHPLFTQLVDVLPSACSEEKYQVPFPGTFEVKIPGTSRGKDRIVTMPLSDTCMVMKCVAKSDTLTMAEMPFILLDLLLACEFLQSRNIYHRDISTNNVIVTYDKQLKRNKAIIADFGTSVFGNHNPERSVTTCGFAPPEMSKDTQFIVVTKTYDLFSAACVLYTLSTGKFFHKDSTWKTCITANAINNHRDERLALVKDSFIKSVLSECLGHFASRSSPTELINKYFLPESKYQCHIRVLRRLMHVDILPIAVNPHAVTQDWEVKSQHERLRIAYQSYSKRIIQSDGDISLALKFIQALMARHHTAGSASSFIIQYGSILPTVSLKQLVKSIAESVNYMISMG